MRNERSGLRKAPGADAKSRTAPWEQNPSRLARRAPWRVVLRPEWLPIWRLFGAYPREPDLYTQTCPEGKERCVGGAGDCSVPVAAVIVGAVLEQVA